MTFCSNSVRFEPSALYPDRMQLRCFLFRYSMGGEVIRWLAPTSPDRGWAQQVMTQRLPSGDIQHTGDDPSAIFFMPGIAQLIEDGKCEEL